MNYNNDLPGAKQAAKGNKKKHSITVIYFMDYSPLPSIYCVNASTHNTHFKCVTSLSFQNKALSS